MWRGASGSCSHRIALPSGQRDGSSACGWPTQMVGTSGSMPRAASLQAFDTPSSPGVRCSSATLSEAFAAPCRRLVQRVVDLEIALAVAVLLRRLDIGSWSVAPPSSRLIKLRRRDRADDALARRNRFARRQPHAGGAAVALDDRGDIGAGADLAAALLDQRFEGGEQVLRAALDDRRAGRFQREGDDLGDLRRRRRLPGRARHAAPRAPTARGRSRTGRCFPASRAPAPAPRRERRQGRAGRAARLRRPAA